MATPPVNPGGIPATPPAQEDAERFRDLLNDQGFASHKRNENLHQIAQMVDELDPAERARLLDELSAEDLAKLVDQVDQPGILGTQGLSEEERGALFDDIAQSADPEQVTRFAELVSEHGTGGEIEEFAQAVARTASPQAKQAYIDSLKGQLGQPREFDLLDSSTSSPEARGLATVLGSLRGAAFDRAAASLDDDQLRAVLHGATGESFHQPLSGKGITPRTSVTWDTQPLVDIINASATGTDAEQKARIFQGAADINEHIRNGVGGTSFDDGSREAPPIIDGLTNLLQSDTTGLVDQLTTTEPTGQSLSIYVRQMLEQGRTQELGDMISKLTMGNDRAQSPVEFLNAQETDITGQPYYRNAENLGYFVGAIAGSIEDMNLDSTLASERIGDIYTATALSANQFVPPANKAGRVALVVSIPVAKEFIRDVTSDIQADRLSVLDGLVQLSRPLDPATGEPVRLASDTAFAARVGFIASAGG